MSTRSLPAHADLDQLKLQVKELLAAHRARRISAAARIVAHHPKWRKLTIGAALAKPLGLGEVQRAVAREYGFRDWAELKYHVETGRRVAAFQPHPRYAEALAAFDRGDLEGLRGFLAADPSLARARTHLEPPYGYFTGATLLHHVAGNPGREVPLPANVVDLAQLLLEAGSEPDAITLGRNGGTTMGLVLTSAQASRRGFSGPLIDLLLRHGARLDLEDVETLRDALTNHAPRAAERLIALGAKVDVCAAAALGRIDLLREAFDDAGRLREHPRRKGKLMSERDAVGLALLFAYVNGHRDAVDVLLERNGNWDMTGVNNGTILHRAAWDGDMPMIERLVAKGADIGNRDNPFTSTPLSWAHHNKQTEVMTWMRAHCAIDLHDAVCFDLREHVLARLAQDPKSINRRIDQWEFPLCTPIHWAVWPSAYDVDGAHPYDPTEREALVTLLLERGADPNVVAGNGMTALEIAMEGGARGIVTLLERHGAKRADEL